MSFESESFGRGSEDFRHAEWLSLELGGRIRWNFWDEQWYRFDSVTGLWAPVQVPFVRRDVAEAARRAIGRGTWADHVDVKMDKDDVKAVVRLLNIAPQDRALEALKSFDGYSGQGDEWDQNPYLLGVGNGVIDLTTGEWRQGKPEDLVSKTTLPAWDADAPEPTRFLRFLDEIYDGDEATVAYMKRAIGSILVGRYVKAFMLLLGNTDTGKSTIIEVLARLMGTYTCPLSIKSFSRPDYAQAGSGHTRDLMNLPGKRFAYAVESDEGTKLHVGLLKSMTGGEPQVLQAPYARIPREHAVTWKVWLATNTTPEVHDESDATWERMQSIPHDVRFWKADAPNAPDGAPRQDPKLMNDLIEELPGILRLAVTWAREYIEAGETLLPLPVSAQNLRNELEAEQGYDALSEWFELRMVQDPAAAMDFADAYALYQETSGILSALDKGTFGKLLKKRALQVKRVGGGATMYLGVRARVPTDGE